MIASGYVPEFERDLDEVLAEVRSMLLEKNKKYGDSALNPVRIFSNCDPLEALHVRMDDKLSRLSAGNKSDDEDPKKDLIGYLIIERIAIKRQERKKNATK